MQSGQYDKMIWTIVNDLLKKVNKKYYYNGLENDLFQEGYIGLLTAEQKYSSKFHTQFSTFAYKYIYGFCLNYLKKEFIFLNCDDIENSPFVSSAYEINDFFEINIIQEINNKLKSINKKLNAQEENILVDKIYRELSLKKCAERNNCSTKKVMNVINKYKDLIRSILINNN